MSAWRSIAVVGIALATASAVGGCGRASTSARTDAAAVTAAIAAPRTAINASPAPSATSATSRVAGPAPATTGVSAATPETPPTGGSPLPASDPDAD